MFDTDNRLLTMIEQQQIPLGMQCFTGHRALIEVMGLTGFDFVMIDTEHSPADPRAMEDSVLAAESVGLVPLVRVPHCDDETAIRRAMEAGAQGLFVPMAKSAADVQRVLDAALFPPMGTRGICPSTRAAKYSFRSFVEYAEWNNRNLVVIPLIEHPDAVDNIDEICALDQVRILAFGAGDLAYALGEGTNMTKSPKIREAYQKVKAAAERHNVAIMGGPVLDPTAEGCTKALEDGVKVFCLGLDVLGFRRFCEDTVHALHTAAQNSALSRPLPPASGFPER
ncbi:HpcH/HpaI aldolase family protein [Streptomyces sp. A5-4]|uniref:HpcH/HpaI aldolase family protein n=1 Tax=Streptomyces sp. A5-4 TaxID=3384771 RepID=UPI003DA83109